MAYLTTQTVELAGVEPSLQAAASGGDTFTPSDRTFFHVLNGNAASVTVVIDDPNSSGPTEATSFDPDVTVVVEPAGTRLIGPVNAARFGSSDDTFAHVSYSTAASVTVGVFALASVAI